MKMANPIAVLDKPQDRNIVIMILTMLDGKTANEYCDILDIVSYFLREGTEEIWDYDNSVFKVEKIKKTVMEGLKTSE